MINLLTHGAYIAVILILTTLVPKGALGMMHEQSNTILVLGFLGTWRYTWAAINFSRALLYLKVIYPRRKAKAFARFETRGAPCHAYFLVTSYMVDRDITIDCYRALYLAASQARDGATIITSVVDGADERLIQSLYNSAPHDMSRVKLVIDRIKANGKRDALAQTLKLIAAECPTARDIIVFVDGDTMVPADIVAQAAPMFTNPRVGALTTDEGIIIERKNLFRDWFILRFNQRQAMMSSMGVSNRVLTLTGRMSVFRADLATNPDFVNGVNYDFLDHWRLGRVKFLTGDDKSTWYWLLKNGYEMAYLPDVQSLSMETQPRPTFYDSSKVLMTRWFGNMMRTNGRAVALGPRRI
ncbi:MAG: glycosyltransferase, partial [Candidatus Saccharibacteria bacterium]|nr:glycosyltransferase [Pseudorhodobacter sp.]